MGIVIRCLASYAWFCPHWSRWSALTTTQPFYHHSSNNFDHHSQHAGNAINRCSLRSEACHLLPPPLCYPSHALLHKDTTHQLYTEGSHASFSWGFSPSCSTTSITKNLWGEGVCKRTSITNCVWRDPWSLHRILRAYRVLAINSYFHTHTHTYTHKYRCTPSPQTDCKLQITILFKNPFLNAGENVHIELFQLASTTGPPSYTKRRPGTHGLNQNSQEVR